MPIENIDPIFTFVAGTTLGSVAGYLIRVLIEHRLAKSLAASDRYFTAAQKFRVAINEAVAEFEPIHRTWTGSNKNAAAMRNFTRKLDVTISEFAEFKGIDRGSFTNKWNETKEYCSTTLPRALTQSDAFAAQQAQNTFLNHVSELLSHAKPT